MTTTAAGEGTAAGRTETTDVLVAGAGPTGLMLACELALAGVRVVVLEKMAEPSGQTKALNLQPRTAEILEARGLLAAARERAMTNIRDTHFGGLRTPLEYAALDTRHPYQVGIRQSRVEEVVAERLAESGTAPRRGHALASFTQDAAPGDGGTPTGVTAEVDGPDGRYRIAAGWLVGCDGGRSTVRRGLGAAFPGTDATTSSIVADVHIPDPPASLPGPIRCMADMGAARRDGGFAQVVAMPLEEADRYRVVVLDGGEPKAPVDPEAVAAAVRRGYGADRVEVQWCSRFSDAARQVEQYRTGRVLLAGDAAHIHLPAGGQGLNLGVQDAMNLGWKLAATVRGTAPAGLLDSYHDERHPVGAAVLENTRAQGALMRWDEQSVALRRVLADVLEQPDANRRLVAMASGLAVRYPMPGPAHPLLGLRLPDVDLPSGRACELLRDGTGVLLTADTGGPAAKAAARAGDRIHTAHAQSGALPDGAADVLVRPDGHVCWVSGTPGETDGLEAALDRWFTAG